MNEIFCIVENMFQSYVLAFKRVFQFVPYVFGSLIHFGNACLYPQLPQACIPEVFMVIAILGLAIVAMRMVICFAFCISKLKSLTVITMLGPASLLEAKSNLALFLFQIGSFVLAFSL